MFFSIAEAQKDDAVFHTLRVNDPTDFHWEECHAILDLEHPDVRTTNVLVTVKDFWSFIDKYINFCARVCSTCQTSGMRYTVWLQNK